MPPDGDAGPVAVGNLPGVVVGGWGSDRPPPWSAFLERIDDRVTLVDMSSTDDLLAHLKALPDRAARYAWLDGLDRRERNALLNRLPDQDRQRYRAHEKASVKAGRRQVAEDDAAARRKAALAGHATETADMIEALYTRMERLTEAQREWVERIDQTAAGSRRDGFTARQASVIADMYRKQFQKPR